MSGLVDSNFTKEGICIVDLEGEISSAGAEELQLALIDSFDLKCYFVIINLSKTENIYAPAFKILSWAAEVIVSNKGRVVLCGANNTIAEKCDLIGLDEVADLCHDFEMAQDVMFGLNQG